MAQTSGMIDETIPIAMADRPQKGFPDTAKGYKSDLPSGEGGQIGGGYMCVCRARNFLPNARQQDVTNKCRSKVDFL